MSDLIKKLKATPPTITGSEASKLYDEVTERPDAVVYHSTVHGLEPVLRVIEHFIETYAKIGPTEDQYIYSYQPFSVGYFILPDARVVSGHNEIMEVSVWFMVYSNCVIIFYEMGAYKDICIMIDQKDFEEMVHGSKS